MFNRFRKSEEKPVLPPPPGVSELIICVFDEKQRVSHYVRTVQDGEVEDNRFRLLNDPDRAFESHVIQEAVDSRHSASVSFSYGRDLQKYLYVLPYCRKHSKWQCLCMQIAVDRPDPNIAMPAYVRALTEDRVCLLMVDGGNRILAAGAKVPTVFGYSSAQLADLSLTDLFSSSDVGIMKTWHDEHHNSELNCVFGCLDGARREVEIKKYDLPDGCTLYGIFDVASPQFNEEIAQVSMRERRRIGQDLHDSIGQLLTGISLLSRSLAINLKRDGNPGDEDAAQISDLADDASNQIRQISRGLMPADIVHRGLFDSLRELGRVTTECCGLVCDVQIDESVVFGDGAVETHLFRIAQEAVNNAVRHANADHIDIVLSQHNGQPQLLVRDNGSWRNIMENSGGIGMKTMQYRASAINGHLNIEMSKSGGTQVMCRLEIDELLATRA